jgi:hypothetical protein
MERRGETCTDRRFSPTTRPTPSSALPQGVTWSQQSSVRSGRRSQPYRSRCTRSGPALGEPVQQGDQFVAAVTVVACEIDQVFGLCDHGTTVGAAGDADRAAATHFKQSFVTK